MKLILCYLLMANVIGLLAMSIDKAKAKRGRHRISETALLNIALLGGSFGICIGMIACRHKTQKLIFRISATSLLAFHICIIILFSWGGYI